MMGSRKEIPNKKQTKYETEILPQLSDIKEYVSQGDSVREICKKLSISPDTWYRYCNEHETLSELVIMGRNVLNSEVEKSLIKLCKGYEYEELKTIVEEDKSGKKRTKLEKNKRYQPPSAAAISFFLRNRCPAEWSDKKELVIDTSQNEQARKQMFLNILQGNETETEENEVVDNDQE